MVRQPYGMTPQQAEPAQHFASAGGSTSQGENRPFRFLEPILAPVAGHVHSQLEAAPDSQFVEGAAQVVLDNLLRRTHELADLTISKALPYQGGHLDFFGG